MKFAYTGFDKAGKPVSGSVESADVASATNDLLHRGIYVSEITAAKAEGTKSGSGSGLSLGRGKRLEIVAAFMRQLSVLVATGTTLVEAVASLERQTRDEKFKGVLADVRRRVEEGSQLCDAMAGHPRWFDGVSRSLIAAGESSGRLDAMLQRLAVLLRQQVKVRKTVAGALVYPALLSCVALGVMVIMIGFVLPRFEGLFQSLDTPLPAVTQVLMDFSTWCRSYWWVLIGGVAGAVVGGTLWTTSVSGRVLIQRIILRTPTLGSATRSFATARIARLLSVLLDAKVPLIDSLHLVRDSLTNPEYVRLIERAENAVTQGENISAAFADERLINPSVCEAIRSGERTGRISGVLGSIADYLDEDNEVLVKTITGLLEPAILIVMGLAVGMVAISMFLPLFDLTAAGGHGG